MGGVITYIKGLVEKGRASIPASFPKDSVKTWQMLFADKTVLEIAGSVLKTMNSCESIESDIKDALEYLKKKTQRGADLRRCWMGSPATAGNKISRQR